MGESETMARYDAGAMRRYVEQMFCSAGLDGDKASVVAEILLDADMMGHATHGLALVPFYLEAAVSGNMQGSGEPEVVSDRGACITWRGNRLPGPWLTVNAVELALARAAVYGVVTVAISDSHHIGALAAYLPRATERGCMLLIASSVPSNAGVAPYGGTRAVFTPNPIAAGIPTQTDPILLDISASITTLNLTRQLHKAGKSFPEKWVMDTNGNASNDPDIVISQGGTILPVGGLDHGHKGYSLAILIEALTQGLPGFGRADMPSGTSLSVFIQVIDPQAFGGAQDFKRQMSWLGEACTKNPPRPGVERVRLPGENAMRLSRQARESGVVLSPAVVEGLRAWAGKLSLPDPPGPMATDA